MTTTYDEQDGKAVLHLSGRINVAGSAELKQLLVQAFSTGKALQLDLSTAETIDITAIQLFWSAAHKAEKTGTALTVAGTLPETVLSDVRDAGFEQFPVKLDTETITDKAE